MSEGKTLYEFDWSFDNYQSGNISIEVRPDDTIDESSLINCRHNPREFSRPLGAYNDNAETIEAIAEVAEMIKTSSGQHFHGAAEEFTEMLLAED